MIIVIVIEMISQMDIKNEGCPACSIALKEGS